MNYCGEESVNQTRSNDRIVIAVKYTRWSRTKSKDYHEWRALLTCFASSEWSILSSNSRRTFQVASIPFPVNQCFMVAWQQPTGPSNLCSASMRSSIQPSGSKLRRAPSCFHWGAICLMICILRYDTMPGLRTETHAGTHCEISHVNHLFTTIQSVYSTRLWGSASSIAISYRTAGNFSQF